MKRIVFFLLIACFGSAAHADDLTLWYAQPAEEWVEALPVGNSRLGAMVYGGTANEELQLNEETVWGGGPHRNDQPEALNALPEVRRLVFAGKNKEAEDLINRTFMTPQNGMPYQTIGSLMLRFPGHEKSTNYYRDLDLGQAIATTRYKVGDVGYTREVFASFTDNVIIVRLTADRKGALSFTAAYTSPLNHTVKRQNGKLILSGKGQEHEGIAGAIRVETQTCIGETDGRVTVGDSLISVAGATTATIYISAATNFINYKDVSANESRRATA